MSKEPIKKDEPAVTPQSDEGTAAEGEYHGYSPAQIEKIKAAKDPAPAAPSKESEAVKMPEPEKVKSSDVRTGSPPDDEDDKKGKK